MQLSVHSYRENELVLMAPLAPNINDKGCAFGGSLASMMTLAGWGLVRLGLKRAGYQCDIYVQDSSVQYLAPVWEDFCTIATLADGEDWNVFLSSLTERGRARLLVNCRVPLTDGAIAATLSAQFVAKAPIK